MTNTKLTGEQIAELRESLKRNADKAGWSSLLGSHLVLVDIALRELQERHNADTTPEFYTEASRFLPECLKPEEISGERRNSRIAELMGWFDRYYNGNANPKWFKSHAAELCYYILTATLQAGNSPVIPDCWIPVSERMSETRRNWLDVTVIIAINGEKYGSEALYCSDGKFRWGRDESPIEDVTHWMPLPAAPKQ